jgi:hypothetical protein
MSFKIESDRPLAELIDPRAGELHMTGVLGAGSHGEPYVLPSSPLDVLLAVGRVTAAIFSPLRQLFDVSSQWAVVRWFWALDWTTKEVTLSPAAESIRNHHRTAFSEALGLAAALLVVEHIAGNALPPGVWNGGPMLVDVDSLVSSGTRPDLLVLFGGPHPAVNTYVLEAKGNRSGRSSSVAQLRNGIEQVQAAHGVASRLVVGAAAPGPDFDVFAISVPRGGSSVSTPSELSVEEARVGALPMEFRRLSSFAGAGAPPGWTAPGVYEIPDQEIELVGSQLTVPGGRMPAEITLGVERQVIAGLDEVQSIEELFEMRSALLADAHGRTPEPDTFYGLTETGRASAVALDGCVLSARLL